MADDPHDLQRFVDAQATVYAQVLAELRAGAKRSHWMWFVFAQLRGLGRSPMAERFGIASREEAIAYLAHPLLGARLKECTEHVVSVQDKSALAIFGTPDELKFRSSMSLFARVAPHERRFQHALDRYFGGAADTRTLELLR